MKGIFHNQGLSRSLKKGGSKRTGWLLLILFFVPSMVMASGAGHDESNSLVHRMTLMVFQVAIIIFAARIGNTLIRKIKMPSVLGELMAGIVISPYLLGAISLPGFPNGCFPMPVGGTIPVSAEIYSFATMASIILLFFAGLETNIKMFLRFSVAGTVVGVGGVLVTFFVGAWTGKLVWGVEFMDPKALFLGVMSTATSVGITTRILSDRRKMDSPEGVTTMAGAVIDDILGIILLAVVIGYCLSLQEAGAGGVAWGEIGMIAAKALSVWIGFTVIGMMLAQRISSSLKHIKNERILAIIAFAMSLVVAGIFEQAGLAMIIGAFVMGLILSNTDLHYLLQERLRDLHVFLVPILFTVMGMLIDFRIFFDSTILISGVIYAVGAIIAKMVGCGLPALFLNFNSRGAMSIALGMVPRCEVVLIIAGIGFSYGFIDNSVFGAAVILIFLSMLTAPPLLNILLKSSKATTRKKVEIEEKMAVNYTYPSEELTEIFAGEMLKRFKKDGFFVTTTRLDSLVHRISRDRTMISMYQNPDSIVFKIDREDEIRINEISQHAYKVVKATFARLQEMEELD